MPGQRSAAWMAERTSTTPVPTATFMNGSAPALDGRVRAVLDMERDDPVT